MGADGLVMSYTNVDPNGCLSLIRAVREGDSACAERLQRKFLAVWNSFPAGVNFVAKVKSILASRNLCQNYCAAPVQTVEPTVPRVLEEEVCDD